MKTPVDGGHSALERGSCRVVLVEDNPRDAELVLRELRRSGLDLKATRVETEPTYVEALKSGVDLILSDFSLPQFDGIRAMKLLRELGMDMPFILISGTLGEDAAVAAMKHGATDYLLKSNLARLGHAVERALSEHRLRDARREAEAARRRSEAIGRAIIASTLDGIVSVDRDGRIIELNPAAERMFGHTRHDALGKGIAGLIPDRLRETHRRGFEALLATGHSPVLDGRLEVVGLRADGTEFPIELTIVCLDRHQTNFTAFVRDISERKQAEAQIQRQLAALDRANRMLQAEVADRTRAEAELQASLDEISDLYNNAPCGYHSTRRDGTIMQMNDTELAWLGYTREGLVGKKTLNELVSESHRARAMALLAEVETTGHLRDVELEFVRQDGSILPVLISSSTVVNEAGQFLMTRATAVDLTALKRAEAEKMELQRQFHQAQKMEAIGRLASGVAHDFNNLLTAVLGYSELLLDALPHDDARRGDVDEIRKAGESAAALTRQLLAFSRQQILQPVTLNLNTIVTSTENLLRRVIGEDIALATSLEPALWSVRADPNQLEQVLLNLAVNARDAMAGGGSLRIATANADMRADEAWREHGRPQGRYVVLTVTDTGSGMSEEVQSRMFEPFFTTKESGKGTGLGLSTVFGIVKQSNGYIDVESTVGLGTTFTIFLMQVEGEYVAPSVGDSRRSEIGGSETILLVEDDERVRSLVLDVLQGTGYAVHAVASAEEALAPGLVASTDLLVTDLILPGMDGHRLATALKVGRPDLKVLYMSGYAGASRLYEKSFGPGESFLEKPFTPRKLALKVRDLLDG